MGYLVKISYHIPTTGRCQIPSKANITSTYPLLLILFKIKLTMKIQYNGRNEKWKNRFPGKCLTPSFTALLIILQVLLYCYSTVTAVTVAIQYGLSIIIIVLNIFPEYQACYSILKCKIFKILYWFEHVRLHESHSDASSFMKSTTTKETL